MVNMPTLMFLKEFQKTMYGLHKLCLILFSSATANPNKRAIMELG